MKPPPPPKSLRPVPQPLPPPERRYPVAPVSVRPPAKRDEPSLRPVLLDLSEEDFERGFIGRKSRTSVTGARVAATSPSAGRVASTWPLAVGCLAVAASIAFAATRIIGVASGPRSQGQAAAQIQNAPALQSPAKTAQGESAVATPPRPVVVPAPPVMEPLDSKPKRTEQPKLALDTTSVTPKPTLALVPKTEPKLQPKVAAPKPAGDQDPKAAKARPAAAAPVVAETKSDAPEPRSDLDSAGF